MNAPLWVASELVTQLGVVLLYGFTQQVFRPGVAWAKALIAGRRRVPAGGARGRGLRALGGSRRSLLGRGDAHVAAPVLTPAYAGCFVWTAIESLHHYGMARRRQALGLADPVVASRFLLWGFYGLAATGIMAANALGVLLGHNISTSLVVLVPSGVLGFAASISIYFVFLPPAWYLGWLRSAQSA